MQTLGRFMEGVAKTMGKGLGDDDALSKGAINAWASGFGKGPGTLNGLR